MSNEADGIKIIAIQLSANIYCCSTLLSLFLIFFWENFNKNLKEKKSRALHEVNSKENYKI